MKEKKIKKSKAQRKAEVLSTPPNRTQMRNSLLLLQCLMRVCSIKVIHHSTSKVQHLLLYQSLLLIWSNSVTTWTILLLCFFSSRRFNCLSQNPISHRLDRRAAVCSSVAAGCKKQKTWRDHLLSYFSHFNQRSCIKPKYN